jgi:SAM-dependent methyltransferase
MTTYDVFSQAHDLDDATVQQLGERLEQRARDPAIAALREDYLDRLQLPSDAQVLELGCGTGVVARAVARRPSFAGRVVGLDLSPALIAVARNLAHDEGLDQRLVFHVGNACRLEYAAARFDAVIAHTLLTHVTDPLAVLREAARVLAPHGRLAIFDGDYAASAFGSTDPALGRAVEAALLAALVASPRVVRELPRLLREAGLVLVDVAAYLVAEIGTGSAIASRPEVYGPLLVQRGALEPDLAKRWMAEQREAVRDGTFFGATPYYTYIARPAAAGDATATR